MNQLDKTMDELSHLYTVWELIYAVAQLCGDLAYYETQQDLLAVCDRLTDREIRDEP